MPEDLKLSQIGSAPLPLPFGALHSPGVRKHSNYVRLLFPEIVNCHKALFSNTRSTLCAVQQLDQNKKITCSSTNHSRHIYICQRTQSIATGMHGLHRPVKRPVQRKVLSWAHTEWYDSQTDRDPSKVSHIYRLYNTEIEIMSTLQ